MLSIRFYESKKLKSKLTFQLKDLTTKLNKQHIKLASLTTLLLISVTRLGDLLDFGQLFKTFGNNYFAKISHILGKGVKIFNFLVK